MNPTVTSEVEPSARAAVVATTFAHPAHVVWTLFSDPSKLALWWGPPGMSMVVHEHDLRPGGAVEFAVSAGATELSGRWTVHDVDEPRRLRFTFASDGLDPTEITIDLHETSTGSTVSTAMTITCSFTSDTRMRQALDIGFIEGLARAVATAHAQLGRPAVRSPEHGPTTREAP